MSLLLQHCATCGRFQYPRRDVCRHCLSDALEEAEAPDTGRLLAQALVRRTLAGEFAASLPLAIGKVQLDCGVHMVCFLEGDIAPEARVTVAADRNIRGEEVWRASAPA